MNELNKELRDPKYSRGSRIKGGEVSAVQTDTATILKKRLTKLIINNKEKVKLIDNYQRNMKVIDGDSKYLSNKSNANDSARNPNLKVRDI